MLLSTDNTKLGMIASFAISTKSCSKYKGRKYQGCCEYCYAKRIERLRLAARAKWEANLIASKKPGFVMQMCDELRFVGDYVRIHVSGDFYSQAYFDKWVIIANRYPHKTFLAYTKAIDVDMSKRPKNLICILSDDKMIWADKHNRFDGVATMQNGVENISTGFWFKCPYVDEHATCDKCLYCFDSWKPRIFFKKH